MKGGKKSYLVKIYGIVQGLGFRPYIYKKAKEFKIKGWVNNFDSCVVISAEGEKENIGQFLIDVVKKPPQLARIEKVEVFKQDICGYEDFIIKKSKFSNEKLKFILPDIATCNKCVEDIFNKDSKRYRYAFTNCTLCGPRYSIIKSLPYDRCNTTMDNFNMCNLCEKEYKNSENRRFHAQPTCCIDCGPKLALVDNKGEKIQCLDELKACVELLKRGKLIAIKGVGGFHIVCDASNREAVLELRKRKRRKDKPLGIMMKDIDEVKKYCKVNKKEEEILISNKRPIVLLWKKNNNDIKNIKDIKDICEEIAPRINKLGIMLPYTPIHYLLFKEESPPLIMTSANISGNPIEYTNEGALKNICGLVDYFLLNNRDINTPIDDSVVKVLEDRVIVSRPGRGYSPYCLQRKIKNKILACGSDMKNTFSFAFDGIVYMSQYLGDLKEINAYREYVKAINNMKNIFNFNPEIIAFDMHPNYMSTVYAMNLNNENKIGVQHHHAHMASCMLEHHIFDDVIGIIYDGTGYGIDKNTWGGEFLIGSRKSFNRVGHFKYVKIQGGDSAQKNIWKIGVSYLKEVRNEEIRRFGLKRICGFLEEDISEKDISEEYINNILNALEYDLNCYKTSSLGRLYDGVCSILGLRQNINYDGQGAIELENIVEYNTLESYGYLIEKEEGYIVDHTSIIIDILKDIKNGISISKISGKFHNTIVNITVEMACRLRKDYGINKVVLSGGVFENMYLLENIYELLKEKDFSVFFNESIPTNDSGISLGQIAVADAILSEKGI